MKKVLIALCALLLMPTLATANSGMISISELRQQVEAMEQWTQNDTVNGKIIEINAPIMFFMRKAERLTQRRTKMRSFV